MSSPVPSFPSQDELDLPEHRQAVLISGSGCEEGKLLSVPVVADGTGREQAQATLRALDDWNIHDQVQGLCFDTTASNTGRLQGAMVRLESALGRRLFRLACRHHVLELVVKAVATSLFGGSTGPSNPLFDFLKARYLTIVKILLPQGTLILAFISLPDTESHSDDFCHRFFLIVVITTYIVNVIVHKCLV